MKIAFVTPDGLSTLIFCSTFSRVLSKHSEHDIYTISDIGEYGKDLEALPATHINLPMYRYINLSKDIKYFISLYKIFRSNKFDVVINFTTKPNIYGVFAAYLAGVRGIFMAVRGLGRTFAKPKTKKELILHYLVKFLYRLSSYLSSKVWFTNKDDMNIFLKSKMLRIDKAILTRNAVDISKWHPKNISKTKINNLKNEFNIKEGDLVILMVARLIWAKGIKEFVEASKVLSLKYPNLKFLLVAPHEAESLDSVPVSYIKKNEEDAYFKWLGFRKDVFDLYSLCDLSVLPSYYKEGGYPRALLEAMALGKPVIAADTIECRSPVIEGENGYLVQPRDTQDLTVKIESICLDDNKLKKFGENSLRLIKDNFDDRDVVKQILDNIEH
mgnify:CR=1 FL=1|tara:strand:- start:1758 stop:2912 length:1155 start_codon:yes stop_codon:yes gene_type:complete